MILFLNKYATYCLGKWHKGKHYLLNFQKYSNIFKKVKGYN